MKNKVAEFYQTSVNFSDFSSSYLQYLSYIFENIDKNILNNIVDELNYCREHDHNIFIAGNGGSSATASHMANDLGTDVMRRGKLDKPFRVFPLTDNMPIITAVANDECYDNIFLNQLRLHFRNNDRLIVISASGNSPNLVKAAEWFKSKGGKLIGLLGFDGGKLASLCDISMIVPSNKGEYGPVEDMHIIINHMISNWLQLSLLNKHQESQTNNLAQTY